jgi:hypothetical protein
MPIEVRKERLQVSDLVERILKPSDGTLCSCSRGVPAEGRKSNREALQAVYDDLFGCVSETVCEESGKKEISFYEDVYDEGSVKRFSSLKELNGYLQEEGIGVHSEDLVMMFEEERFVCCVDPSSLYVYGYPFLLVMDSYVEMRDFCDDLMEGW